MPHFEWKQEDGYDIGISTDYRPGKITLKGHFTNAEKTSFTGTMTYTFRLIVYNGSFILDDNYWVPHGFCKMSRILKKPCLTDGHMSKEWIKYEGEWYKGRKGRVNDKYTEGKKYIYRGINGQMSQVQVTAEWLNLQKHGCWKAEAVPYCKLYVNGRCIYNQEKDYESEFRYKHLTDKDIIQILMQQIM